MPEASNTQIGRRVAGVIAVGVCVAGAAAIWGLIVGRFDATSGRVLGSALAAAIATLSGLAGSTLLSRDGARGGLGRATIAVSGLALVLALLLIWVHSADSDPIFRAFGVAVIATLACAHASLLINWLRAGDARAVAALAELAVAAAATAALLLSSLLLLAHSRVAAGVWRLLGVLIVIAVLATLLAPLTRRIRVARESSDGGAHRSASSNGLR